MTDPQALRAIADALDALADAAIGICLPSDAGATVRARTAEIRARAEPPPRPSDLGDARGDHDGPARAVECEGSGNIVAHSWKRMPIQPWYKCRACGVKAATMQGA